MGLMENGWLADVLFSPTRIEANLFRYSRKMISNTEALNAIREAWKAVRKVQSQAHYAMLPPGGVHQFCAPDYYFNLPFLLAYSVLEEVLTELTNQGTLTYPDNLKPNQFMKLGRMIESAKTLNWNDFKTVGEDGLEARNDLAHRAILLSKQDCHKYIEAIELELKTWGVL